MVSNFIIYHVVDGVRKLVRSNTMAASTPLEEPAALAKRIEDFVKGSAARVSFAQRVGPAS
jgi:hypothetical protein